MTDERETDENWRIAAANLGLDKAAAQFPADVEAGFKRAQMLRTLVPPRSPLDLSERDA